MSGIEVIFGAEAKENLFQSEHEKVLALGGQYQWFFNGGSDTRRHARDGRREKIASEGGEVIFETGCQITAKYCFNPAYLAYFRWRQRWAGAGE